MFEDSGENGTDFESELGENYLSFSFLFLLYDSIISGPCRRILFVMLVQANQGLENTST